MASSQLLFLSSADADGYLGSTADGRQLTSSFYVSLNESITTHNDNTHILMSLVDAQIPNSIYTVSGRNDKVDVLIGGTTHTCTLQHGNYTATTLLTELNRTTNSAGATDSSLLRNVLGSAATYDSIQNTITFHGTASFQFMFKTGPSANTSARKVLGFSHADTVTGTSITSDTVVDVGGGLRTLYLRCNLASGNTYDTRNKGTGSILAKIPVNAEPFGVILFTGFSEPFKMRCKQREVRSIEARLTDEQGNANIDLNGLHWNFTLQFDFVHAQEHPPDPVDPRIQFNAALNQETLPEATKKELQRQKADADLKAFALLNYEDPTGAMQGLNLTQLVNRQKQLAQ